MASVLILCCPIILLVFLFLPSCLNYVVDWELGERGTDFPL